MSFVKAEWIDKEISEPRIFTKKRTEDYRDSRQFSAIINVSGYQEKITQDLPNIVLEFFLHTAHQTSLNWSAFRMRVLFIGLFKL